MVTLRVCVARQAPGLCSPAGNGSRRQTTVASLRLCRRRHITFSARPISWTATSCEPPGGLGLRHHLSSSHLRTRRDEDLAQPERGADGSQPFRSVQPRTSAAAGPHRSRSSLGRSMRKPLKIFLCEVVAATLLAGGAFLLVAVYLPFINPSLFGWATDEHGRTRHASLAELGEPSQPLSYYVIGTPLSLGLLAAAWHFNLKALRSRGET